MQMKPQHDSDLRQAISQRLSENYQAFVAEWERMNALDLINKSDEIAATRKCYWGLRRIPLDDESMEFLLRFQNPLEVVRDRFLIRTDVSTNSFFDDYELPNTVESVFTAELDEVYPMMEGYGGTDGDLTMG